MYLFRRARVPLSCLPASLQALPAGQDARLEPWAECDITVEGPRIVAVSPSTAAAFTPSPTIGVTDLHGVIVLPGLLDVHTHLDKAHTWHRAPNPTGEFWDAIKALGDDSRRWTEADIYRRANFALRSAHAHGTNALRSHIDTGAGAVGEPGHAALQQLRQEWRGRIHLQTVSLCNLSAFAQGDAHRIVELTARYGATALGGFPQPNPDLPRQYDALMAAARELGIGLDLHVDESGLAHAEYAEADHLMQAIEDKAHSADAFDRIVWHDVALPAARGVLAHARRNWADAARALTITNPRLSEIGGSHAQRDLFGQILLDAHLKLGNWAIAERMLEMRRTWDPDGVPLNRDLATVRAHLAVA